MVWSIDISWNLMREINFWQNLLKPFIVSDHKHIFIKLRNQQILIFLVFLRLFSPFFNFDLGRFIKCRSKSDHRFRDTPLQWRIKFSYRIIIKCIINTIFIIIRRDIAAIMLALRSFILSTIQLHCLDRSFTVDSYRQKVPEHVHQVGFVPVDLRDTAISLCF